MIITSEYVYDYIKLNETRNIVQNTTEEYDEEYGFNINNRGVRVKCIAEFYDKIINDTKIVIIGR